MRPSIAEGQVWFKAVGSADEDRPSYSAPAAASLENRLSPLKRSDVYCRSYLYFIGTRKLHEEGPWTALRRNQPETP